MSAADRSTDYSDQFDDGSYTDGDTLVMSPQWGSIPDTISPIVWYADPVGAIYTVTPDIGVLTSALHESDYPLNQFAGIKLNGVTNGFYLGVPNDIYDAHAGNGVLVRYVSGPDGTSYYRATFNGNANKIYLHRIVQDSGGVVLTIAHTILTNENYYVEAEHTGTNTTDVRIYQDDALLGTYTDNSEITGLNTGVVLHTYGALNDPVELPSIYTVWFGHLDSLSLRSFDLVNPDGTVKSLGPISTSGSSLGEVTGGEISEGGSRAYPLVMSSATPDHVYFDPIDILDTRLPYGTLTMTLFHGEGNLERDFEMAPPDDWQAVFLSSPNTAYMAKDLTSPTTNDILEVPVSVNSSSLTLLTDSDVIYDGAVVHGTRHNRRFYDQTVSEWDFGVVTINQEAAVPDPTAPTYPAMECFYGVYFEHDFSVGWTDADPNGYSAIDLPAGLTINSAGFCSGTPTLP
jgi:hypothetical protein